MKIELARTLGITPETLSRTFARFKAAGLIELNGRRVKILDRPRLEELKGFIDNLI